MKRVFHPPLNICLLLLLYGCSNPCETQSFHFAQDTITFPTDVETLRQKYQDIELAVNSTILLRQRGDTALRYYFSPYEEDRFAPDGEDGYVETDKGHEVPDTLGKGIYSYCYYLPDSAYDETFQNLVRMYGKNYQEKVASNSVYKYLVWELSECTRLVLSSIRNPSIFKQEVTFVEFVHRLNDREIDNTVHLGGSMGKPFD